MLQGFLTWISNHYVEVLGTIFGLFYIFLSIKQSVWCWPFGLISSVIYIFVFFYSGFYADMGLQFYYVFISIYGWYNWVFGGKKEINKTLHISVTSTKLWIKLFIANTILFVIISYILINHTDSTIPYWDAFTTAASIVATWMLAQKKIEHWLIWIVVDIVSLGLYIYKDLFATVILFAVYTILALIGYLEWRKDLKKILKEL